MFVSVPNTIINHIMETTDTLTLTLTPHSGNTLAEKGMKKEQNNSNASRSSIKMTLKSTIAGGNATNPRDQSSAENADISSNDTTSDESDDELEALVMDDEDESLSHIFVFNMDSLSKRESKVHVFVRPGKRREKTQRRKIKAMIRSLKKRQAGLWWQCSK